MSSSAFGSRTLKSIVGLVVLAAGAVGVQSSDAAAIRSPHRFVESSACHGNGDHGRHHGRGHERGSQDAREELTQSISARVPATTFLRVDVSGRVISAATNTGCRPSKHDDVFLLRPGGTIEQGTALFLDHCNWTGNFTQPGVFQPQACQVPSAA